MQVWVCLCIVPQHIAAPPAVEQGTAVGAGAAAAIRPYIYFGFLSAWYTAHLIEEIHAGSLAIGGWINFCEISKKLVQGFGIHHQWASSGIFVYHSANKCPGHNCCSDEPMQMCS